MPPMFPVYLMTNLALVVLGYESCSSRNFPHWLVFTIAGCLSVIVALQWSRTLLRAYRREDRTYSMFEALYNYRFGPKGPQL